jgi:hypothetical protein
MAEQERATFTTNENPLEPRLEAFSPHFRCNFLILNTFR